MFCLLSSQMVTGSMSKEAETSLLERETQVSTLHDSDPGPSRRKMAACLLGIELWRLVITTPNTRPSSQGVTLVTLNEMESYRNETEMARNDIRMVCNDTGMVRNDTGMVRNDIRMVYNDTRRVRNDIGTV